jgi:hypothetical protein
MENKFGGKLCFHEDAIVNMTKACYMPVQKYHNKTYFLWY